MFFIKAIFKNSFKLIIDPEYMNLLKINKKKVFINSIYNKCL